MSICRGCGEILPRAPSMVTGDGTTAVATPRLCPACQKKAQEQDRVNKLNNK